jgi:hypothetical protein
MVDPKDTTKAGTTGLLEISRRGWESGLAALVSGLLFIEIVTGLWIYLAPFSIPSQIQVILHALAGVVLLGPYTWYQVRHLVTWFSQKLTVVMVLGYASGVVILACLVSGVVLTWEAAFGPKLSSSWDMVHLVTGLSSGIVLLIHLVLAWVRRSVSARKTPEYGRTVRGFVRKTVGATVLCAIGTAALSVAWPREVVEFPPPEDYNLPAYAQQFDEYRGSNFAPAYARTESGMLVSPDILAHSDSCGSQGCHEQILAEWQPSAHRFSAMNPPFLKVQRDFAVDREPAETRYCAGCHDPISLFAGEQDIHMLDSDSPGLQDGISCVVCHCISTLDQRGNADYVLTPPQKYLGENTEGLSKYVSDFLIRAYPRQHLVDYDRNILRTPEFCGVCHKQFIPEALNRFGVSPGQNQYDEWRQSHWHVDDPQEDLSCRDCHMRLVYDSTDPGRGEDGDARRSSNDRAHRHHGSVATNLLMPEVLKLEHWEEQVELTREWMRGETVLPEIAEIWPEGPIATLDLQAPKNAVADEVVKLRVVVTNRKMGHNFTTGPLDFVRAWVHLRVLDENDKTIAEWGDIDPETRRINDVPGQEHRVGNSRKEGTLVLEAEPQDEHGKALVQHELWKKAGGAGLRVIFPNHSDTQAYDFVVPKDARGELRIVADLNFRRYRQEFLDLVVPNMEKDSGVLQPTVTQTSTVARIRIDRP